MIIIALETNEILKLPVRFPFYSTFEEYDFMYILFRKCLVFPSLFIRHCLVRGDISIYIRDSIKYNRWTDPPVMIWSNMHSL